jgi:hypothetical protein
MIDQARRHALPLAAADYCWFTDPSRGVLGQAVIPRRLRRGLLSRCGCGDAVILRPRSRFACERYASPDPDARPRS